MKILVIDIETSPSEGMFWDKPWETSIIKITKQGTILCFAYQWVGGKTKCIAQCDFNGYKGGKLDDYYVVKALRDLIDEADVVLGQNSDKFDIKYFNTRCITHKIAPPSPYKTIDTLKISKKYFLWLTNKLDFVSKQLGHGGKMEHEGFPLWERCIAGDQKAWRKMKKYNMVDVDKTVEIYKDYLPWITLQQPVWDNRACPNCKGQMIKKGSRITADGKRMQEYQCKSCGHYKRGAQVIEKL